MDPVLVRVAFAALLLAGMSSFLLYIVAWIVIPEEEQEGSAGRAPRSSANTPGIVVGAILIGGGAITLLDRLWPHFNDVLWPVALIAIGGAVILQGTRR